MSLQITKVNAPQSKLKSKAPYSMDPIGVTIHETGNIATAMAEVSYMLGNNSSTGYHFAADDTRVVQGLPLNRNAFHSGDGSTGRGNRKTIAIETCYNWNGKTTTKNDSKYNPLYQKAVDNVVELTAQLFIQHPKWGAPKSGVNLFQHNHHKSKNCPQRMREEGKWDDFVARVNKRYQELKNPNTKKKEAATVVKKNVSIAGNGHVQTLGWKPMKELVIGTTDKALRLEAFDLEVKINKVPVFMTGTLTIQDMGDVDFKTNLMGTVGMGKRIEAVKFDIDSTVQYRVHQQSYGWSEWSKNKEWAGVKGKNKRIEAIQFRVVQ